jgi:hypothetical protein
MSNLKASLPLEQFSIKVDVQSWREISAKIAFLSEQLKPIKERLEFAAAKAPEGKIITEEYAISLTLCQRDNFNLKAAKAALGEEKLKPFMTATAYTQLRIK